MVDEQKVTGVRVLKNGMRAGYVLQKDGTRRFRILGKSQEQDGGKKKYTKKKSTKKKPAKKKPAKKKSTKKKPAKKKKQKGGE